MPCPDEETLLAFVDGVLPAARRELVERHIDECLACGTLVADDARDLTHAPAHDMPSDPEVDDDDDGPPVPFAAPRTVGRYVVQEALGAGAMGYVYAAFDPELDRRVALKFVRPSASRRAASQGRQRLVREAQAIARLSHPNVVQVFEVVEIETPSGSGICIVMELVRGESLRHWLATKPRLSSVLAAFEQAASGLAAAHDAGVVHRDFKPENVLVIEGRSGVDVKVMDFGLARARGNDSVAPASIDVSAVVASGAEGGADRAVTHRPDVPAPDLTASGAVLGTPRYMAPEQHRGEEADARSDQFAFCVALYEALYEVRAFSARDEDALEREKVQPRRQPPPRRRGIRPALTAAVLRGLSPRPADRFESMQPLVDVLARARSPRSRLPWAMAGVVAMLGVTGILVVRGSPPAPCSARNDALQAVWNEKARQTLDAAFSEVELAYADQALPRARSGLDDYATRWSETRAEVCARSRTDSEPLLRDRQLACLDRAVPDFEAVVELLGAADARAVQHAMSLIQSLPPPAVCADSAFVRSAVAPPDRVEVAEEVLTLRRRIARIVVHGRTGRAQEVLEDARRAADDAAVVGYSPIEAEARLVLGGVLSSTGRTEEAAVTLADAFWSANETNDHALASRAATLLIFVHGHQRAELDEGKRWARFAETALQRVDADPAAWAVYEYNLATVLSEAGAHAEAIATFARALERYEAAGAGHEVAMAATLNGLAGTQARAGNLGAAREGFERAAALWGSMLGPSHPDVALVLNNLGTVSIDLGDYDRAQGELENALELTLRSLGAEHPSVGDVLLNLGRLHARRGRPDEARREYLRAIEIWTPWLPPDHPRLAQAHNNLGVVAMGAGDAAEALAQFDTALASWERSLGPGHPRLVMTLENRAEALMALQRVREAAASLERALLIVNDAWTGAEAERARARIETELARSNLAGRPSTQQ